MSYWSFAIEQFGFATQRTEQRIAALLDEMEREVKRPSSRFRPKIFQRPHDGSWCALYGESIEDGIAGFGATPQMAVDDFDFRFTSGAPHASRP